MSYKKCIITLILAIFILCSMASVCAANMEDNNIQMSNDLTGEVIASEVDNDGVDSDFIASELDCINDNSNVASSQPAKQKNDSDFIASVEENDRDALAANNNKHSFAELQGLIDNAAIGGEISLNYDYSLAVGGSTIRIEDGLTINGNGHTLDGANLDRIFSVSYYTEFPLILKNIKFKNGGAQENRDSFETDRGGAICFTIPGAEYGQQIDDTLGAIYDPLSNDLSYTGYGDPYITIINCDFMNNCVSDAGGAIYTETDLTIINSTFSNNVVGDIGNGGAIWCGGKIVADNSDFRSNLVAHGLTNLDLVKDVKTWWNTYKYYVYHGLQSDGVIPPTGGAIFCMGTAEINHCEFSNNQVGEENEMGVGGGAIHSMGSILVQNSNFISNEACDQFGGAILSNQYGFIYDSTFRNNIANSGGAVCTFWDLKLYRSEFYNNGHEKGTTWIEGQSMEIVLYDVPIVGTTLSILDFLGVDVPFLSFNSQSIGGAAHSGNYIYAEGCTFDRNQASEWGGAVYSNGNADIKGCTFSSNEVSRADNILLEALNWQSFNRDGGAIHANGYLTIKNSEFRGNSAPSSGGAVYSGGECEVSSCEFASNTVYLSGGAIYAQTVSKITNSIFERNSVTKPSGKGGAVFINGDCNPQFTSCEFISNLASRNAGAIFINGGGSNLKISKSSFNKNIAHVDGGAIWCRGKTVISDSQFNSNQADGEDTLEECFGGAVYSNEDSTIKNCGFSRNSAFSKGGAVYAKKKVKIDDSEFFANSANDGGAVYAAVINDNIYNTVFRGNIATRGDGGAIYVSGDSYPKIISCVFEGNTCISKFTIGNTDIIASRGGAIFAPEGHLKVDKSTFTTNHGHHGGAIYVGIITDITNSNFIENKADSSGDGGAIYVCKKCTFTVSQSTFERNKAGTRGGAIYTGDTISPYFDSAIRVYSSEFIGNSAKHGGAIYTGKMVDYPNNVRFIGNTASNGNGGAIFLYRQCKPEFMWCTFENNTAYTSSNSELLGNGGGIYFDPTVENSRVKITSCTFINNEASHNGGGIYVEEASFIQGSTFIKNNAGSNGGAVYVGVDITQDILRCVFEENSAERSGGAICAGTSKVHRIQFCQFINNSALSGGGVYVGQIRDCIVDSVFIGNKAYNSQAYVGTAPAIDSKYCRGGAVYVADSVSIYKFFLLKCRFENNWADNIGGAIYTMSLSSQISEVGYCSFVNNHAYGIYYDEPGDSYVGHSIFASGSLDNIYGVWMGTNSPQFKQEFVKYNLVVSDTQLTPSYYLKIKMNLNEANPVVGNPYLATISFYRSNSNGGMDYTVFHSTASFYGDGEFINNKEDKNSMTATVVLNSGASKIYGKLDNQEVSLNVYPVDKNPCSVNITSCDNVQYPDALIVNYEIEHLSNITYEIMDSEGEIVKTGNLTDPNTACIDGLNPGSYIITIRNHESFYYLEGSASASFNITKGNIEEFRVVVYNRTSNEDVEGIIYASCDGQYNLTVAGITKVVTVKNRVGYFNLGNFANGNYEAVISFKKHELYDPFSNSTKFTVSDDNVYFKINFGGNEFYFGDDIVITPALPNGATGTVTYSLIDGTVLGETQVGESFTLPMLNIGNHIIIAHYSGDGNFASDFDIEQVNIYKTKTEFSLIGYDDLVNYNWAFDGMVYQVERNCRAPITPILPKGATGTVTYSLIDGNFLAELPVSENYITPKWDNDGVYVIVANYSGDANLDPDSAMIYVIYHPYSDSFDLFLNYETYGYGYEFVIEYGETPELHHMQPDFETDDISYYDNGVYFGKTKIDSEYTIYLPVLEPGVHEIKGTVNGKHGILIINVRSNETEFEVNAVDEEINFGETTLIKHVLTENATGTISYYLIDGTFLGEASVYRNFTLPILSGGHHIIVAKYSGDKLHIPANTSTGVFIKAIEVPFKGEISASEINYGGEAIITHVLPDDATGTVTYSLIGGNVLGETQAGENFTVPKLGVGTYEIIANYSGDNSYLPAVFTVSLTVNQNESFEFNAADCESIYGEAASISPVLPDDATGTVTYSLIGGNVLGETQVGENFTIPKLDAGTHEVVVKYSGDSNYASASCSLNVTVNQTKSFEFDLADGEFGYGDAKVCLALPDDATGTVKYYLKQKIVTIYGEYDFLGEAAVGESFALPAFDVGTYEILANYSGDNNYASASDSALITINKSPSSLGVSMVFESGSAGSAYVSFGDALGVKASVLGQPNAVVKVAGNIITVPGLDEGIYTLCITTIPDANHNPVTTFASITVKGKSNAGTSGSSSTIGDSKNANGVAKKATPKLTAKKKTFKRSIKVKKYTITLKTNRNKALKKVKVTLKVKGKTYKAKTNKKGVATFKIKNLKKKGKYTAVIKFAGNKNYKNISKKAKITVK